MVVRMRSTKGHRNNRRSHDALSALAVGKCKKCGAPQMLHRLCTECGNYRDKQILATITESPKTKAKAEKVGAK